MRALSVLTFASLAGGLMLLSACTVRDPIPIESEQLEKQADLATASIEAPGAEVVEGDSPSTGGPTVSSFESSSQFVVGTPNRIEVIAADADADIAAVGLRIDFARGWVRIPASNEGGKATVDLTVTDSEGFVKATRIASMFFIDSEGRRGNTAPILMRVTDELRGMQLDLLTLAMPHRQVSALAFPPIGAGDFIVAGGERGTLAKWDLGSGRIVLPLEGHTALIHALRVSQDRDYIASASQDGTVKVWDAETGELRHDFDHAGDTVAALAISPDGKVIIAAGWDEHLRAYSAETGELLSEKHLEDRVNAVELSHTGNLIAVGTGRLLHAGIAMVRAAPRGEPVHRFGPFEREVTALAFSPNDTKLAVGVGRGLVRIYGLQEDREVVLEGGPDDMIQGLVWMNETDLVAVTINGFVVRWSVPDASITEAIETEDFMLSAELSGDAQQLAFGNADGVARIFELPARLMGVVAPPEPPGQ